MRDPRRSESGDARPDRTDPPAADVAEGVGDPAGGAAALPPAATTPTDAPVEEEAGPSAADTPDARGAADVTPAADAAPADDDLLDDAPDDDVPDDFFLDPLLSDEPIDLAAVRADDALIDALAGDDLDTARDLVDPDDPLIAMLAAWAASARPDDPASPAQRPALSLVPEHDGADPAEAEDDAADTVAPVAAGAGTGAVAEIEHTDAAADPDDAADLDAPTVRIAPAARRPRLVPPGGLAATADDPGPAAGTGVPEGDGPEGGAPEPEVAAADPATTPLRLFPRRRGPGTGRRAPDPFRRAAVVIVAAVLGVSVAAATGGTARPGEPGFAMTRVFFAERAKSLEAAQVVAVGLERARVYLRESQPALAAQELADVQSALPDVSNEDGHNHLADQQQVLATAVAMAPPDPRAGRRAGTPTTTERPDPDTSVLAEAGTPGTTPRTSPRTSPTTAADGSDVVTSPSKGTSLRPRDPATSGSSSAVDGAAAPTTTVGGTTDTASVTAEPTTPTGGTSTETSTSTTETSGGTTTRTTPADPTTTTPTSRDDEPDDPTSTTKKTTKPDRTTEEEEKDSPETSERARDDDTPRAATGSAKVQPAAHHVWGVPKGDGTGRATVAGSRLTATTTVDRPADAERVSRAR